MTQAAMILGEVECAPVKPGCGEAFVEAVELRSGVGGDKHADRFGDVGGERQRAVSLECVHVDKYRGC